LWKLVLDATERGLRLGALAPIPTGLAFIEEGGVRFLVRVMAILARKREERKKQDTGEAAGEKVNPFLPYDRDLFVAEVSDTHVALLNKFNVVDHHLLIVTRHHEEQEALLTLRDFEALWRCMSEYESLGFYNGGVEAGASQRHKHLQVVPLPLSPEGPPVPVEPLLSAASMGNDCLGVVPGFPFLHAFARLCPDIGRSPEAAAQETFGLYGLMLTSLRMSVPERNAERLVLQSLPYCLLVSREWMLLVPRSREHFEDISLNSLAYAGSFFVSTDEQFLRLQSAGPMKALAGVALPVQKD
jgi:ATP adenylyltransferase